MRDLPGAVKADTLSRSSLDYIGQLPYCVIIKTIAGDALLCHGIMDNVMGKVLEEETDLAFNSSLKEFLNGSYPSIMIQGHSHRRMVKQIGGKTIINAGTLFRDHSPCICFIDFENRQVEFNNIRDNAVDECCIEKIRF
jgi:predicted phosphodiesterase